MLSLKTTISNTSLFGMLNDAQLEQIAAASRMTSVMADTNVINHGDAPSGVFWLIRGQVKIAVNVNNGNEKVIEILGKETCFGLGEMLLGQQHLAFVTATTDSMVLHTDRETVLQVAEANPLFAREIMTCVGRQFCGLMRDIDGYSKSAKQRLAAYLLRQSRRETSVDIRLVANKGLIASRLSLTRETLSRLFQDFSKAGLIAVSGRHIKILDQERLALECE